MHTDPDLYLELPLTCLKGSCSSFCVLLRESYLNLLEDLSFEAFGRWGESQPLLLLSHGALIWVVPVGALALNFMGCVSAACSSLPCHNFPSKYGCIASVISFFLFIKVLQIRDSFQSEKIAEQHHCGVFLKWVIECHDDCDPNYALSIWNPRNAMFCKNKLLVNPPASSNTVAMTNQPQSIKQLSAQSCCYSTKIWGSWSP